MFIRFVGTTSSLTVLFRQQMAQIKTFAFLDLETTGLPSLENNKTKITELTIIAVQSEHLALGVIPRVQNKLSLCLNPRKLISMDSERITGLSNFMLEHLAPFTGQTVQMINNFLEHSPKPICLVAHNGNRFDYPILRTEIGKTGQKLLEDILCIDSLLAFRKLHIQETPQLENIATKTKSLDTPDAAIPLELQDGFDEILCQALDEYENDSGPVNKGLKRALAVQKVNETTPKRIANEFSIDQLGLAFEQAINNQGNPKSSLTIRNGGGQGECSNSKKLRPVTSRKRLNFGLSFKLVDVYQRLTNKDAEDAHQAENDVIMLARCAATLGDRFVDWANVNARNFANGPVLVPGKKLEAW